MESDIEALVDPNARDCPSPQFLGTWKQALSSAISLVDRLCDEAGTARFRIALRTVEPQGFCALFYALANRDVDIFLFNPDWSEDENSSAKRIANPRWTIGSCVDGSFEITDGLGVECGLGNSAIGLRVMIPTGGSSGRIRFAIHSSSTLLASVRAFQTYFGAKQVFSHCVLPLYHVSGFLQIVRAMVSNGGIVFGSASRFEKSHSLLLSEWEKSGFVSLVPAQLHRLLQRDSDVALLKNYQAIFVGGGPISEDLLELSRQCELPLAPTYGMTETASMIATLKPEGFLSGRTSQGLPLPHSEIVIVPPKSGTNSEPGKGRIKIKSASLFLGYFGEAEFTDSSYMTNDLGKLEANGELTVLGRLDRVIISGGENINLQEIEDSFLDTGLLREVVAFGIEDREWGSRLCVAYVPKERALEESELRRRVEKRLTRFKLPKSWLKMNALPRNEAGKILSQNLRERLTDKEG